MPDLVGGRPALDFLNTVDPRHAPQRKEFLTDYRALLAVADQTDGNLNFNGDDALVLVFAGTQVVDSFGRVGEDPGDFWSCSEGNTQNHTLRRFSSVCTGDIIVDDEFNPCDEWSFFASDVFTGLGTHIADCGAVGSTLPSWGSLKASFR